MCVSAYLQAAQVLGLEDARKFALRSLDRILSEAWDAQRGLAHVIAYSGSAKGAPRFVRGLLDDYAFTALACLDAYEVTGAMSYFKFAQQIADEMVRRFGDATSGGFFDTEATLEDKLQLGALSARRKPFQDAPTPAGNPSAAIALLRLHAYTNDAKYRDKAEDTLQVFGAMAEQFGIYAGTYGIAATWLSRPHTQAVVVGEDQKAAELLKAAVAPFAVNKSVVHLTDSEAVAQNLPPVLAETVPNLPALKAKTIGGDCVHKFCLPGAGDWRRGIGSNVTGSDLGGLKLVRQLPISKTAVRDVSRGRESARLNQLGARRRTAETTPTGGATRCRPSQPLTVAPRPRTNILPRKIKNKTSAKTTRAVKKLRNSLTARSAGEKSSSKTAKQRSVSAKAGVARKSSGFHGGSYVTPKRNVSIGIPAFWTLRQTNDDLEVESPSRKTSVVVTAFQREHGLATTRRPRISEAFPPERIHERTARRRKQQPLARPIALPRWRRRSLADRRPYQWGDLAAGDVEHQPAAALAGTARGRGNLGDDHD